MELTVDELARQINLPVRTIREYQTLRLLPAPHRRGRVGVYGPEHTERLALIARLQRRGYSLAGIKDLLEAWDAGTNLTALLGVDGGPAALDETPLRLTRAQLYAQLPGLTTTSLRRAVAVGLVQPTGKEFMVRSPALLALAADGVRAGVRLIDVLELVGTLRDHLDALAHELAAQIVTGVVAPMAARGRDADIEALLRRGRLLLLQGAASTLADRLGEALARHADGGVLANALDRIRVGAVTDLAGHIDHRRPQ